MWLTRTTRNGGLSLGLRIGIGAAYLGLRCAPSGYGCPIRLGLAPLGDDVAGGACGHVEIAGEFRRSLKLERLPGDGARGLVARVLVRVFDMVAARQPLDLGAGFGKPPQQEGQILEPFRDNVDDAGFLLHAPGRRDIARAEHDRPEALEGFRPDDDIGERGLVLDREKNDAVGRARPLAHGDEAGHANPLAGRGLAQRLVAQDAAAGKILAQEARRMRAQRQFQISIIVDDLLAERHRRETYVRLAGFTSPWRGEVAGRQAGGWGGDAASAVSSKPNNGRSS